jgi:hypothetical protein
MPNSNNLIPFQKGQSGNPAGRPPIVKELKTFLMDKLSDPDQRKEGSTHLEAIAEKLFEMGKKGNLKAIELIFNYAYGKPNEIGGSIPEVNRVIRPNFPGNE